MDQTIDRVDAYALDVRSQAYSFTATFFDSIRASRRQNESDGTQLMKQRGAILPDIDNIDSVSALVEYLAFMPQHDVDFTNAEEQIRKVMLTSPGDLVSFHLGSGLSFSVRAITRAPLPAAILDDLPEEIRETFKEKHVGMIVIKRPHIEISRGGIDMDSEAKAIRAVARECRVLNHPLISESENIIKLRGVIWEPVAIGGSTSIEMPSLAMEYADQGSLDDLLDSDAYCLHFGIKKKLCMDVARGLAVLHDNFIVHGDVKTENVLLAEKGGVLVAKVADFGCSMHSSGHDRPVQIQGHTPPWDAPEVYHDEIYLSNLSKVDIYCWGLLVWRVMLDGRTPLDFRRKQSPSSTQKFLGISARNDPEEYFSKIQELKMKPGDSFLDEVLRTIADHGLDEALIENILRSTIRYDSSQRAASFHDIVQMMDGQESSDFINKSPASSATEPKSLSTFLQFMDEPTRQKVDLDKQGKIYPSMPKFGHEFGSKYEDILCSKGESPRVSKQVQEDYLRIATDMGNSELTRAHSEFGYALRLLFALNENPDTNEGLRWLRRAAQHGNLEAQAIVYRLHSAFEIAIPDLCPTKEWLYVAAQAGSTIALEDLEQMDFDAFTEVIEYRRRLCWNTELDPLSQALMSYNSSLSQAELLDMLQTSTGQATARINLILPIMLSEGFLDSIDEQFAEPGFPLGYGFIHIFAGIGEPGWVQELLNLGANINLQTALRKETAINCACRLGNIQVVKYLLQKGADLTLPDLGGATFLHYLAYLSDNDVESLSQDLKSVELDVDRVAVPNYKKPFVGEDFFHHGTPLHWAVIFRRRRLIDILLMLGADPLKSDGLENLNEDPALAHIAPKPNPLINSLSSPLAYAISRHQPDIASLFIEHIHRNEGFVDLREYCSIALKVPKLLMMCFNGSLYLQKMIHTVQLLRIDDVDHPMRVALSAGNDQFVRHLLRNGYQVNKVLEGSTPLGLSLLSANGESTLAILEHGADPTMECPLGNAKPLTLLAVRPAGTKTLNITEKMIELGATSAEDPVPHWLLYRKAVLDGRIDVAEFLSNHDIETADNMNMDLLEELLARNGREWLSGTRYLIQSITSPFITSTWTVYHGLCSIKEDTRDDALNLGLLQTLLERFSQSEVLDTKTKYGETALMCAILEGNHYAFDALLRSGASLEAGIRSAKLEVLERLIFSRIVIGGFRGLSSRHRRTRRYEDNSMHMMSILLRHECHTRTMSSNVAKRFIEQELPTWRSFPFALSCMSQDNVEERDSGRLERHANSDEETCGSQYLPKGQFLHASGETYMEFVWIAMWKVIVERWRKHIEGP